MDNETLAQEQHAVQHPHVTTKKFCQVPSAELTKKLYRRPDSCVEFRAEDDWLRRVARATALR